MKAQGLYPDDRNLVLSADVHVLSHAVAPGPDRPSLDVAPSARLGYRGRPSQLEEPIQAAAQDDPNMSFHENAAQVSQPHT